MRQLTTIEKKYAATITKQMDLDLAVVKPLLITYTEYDFNNFSKFLERNSFGPDVPEELVQRKFLEQLCLDHGLSFVRMYRFVNWFQYCVRRSYFGGDSLYKDTFSSAKDFRTVVV